MRFLIDFLLTRPRFQKRLILLIVDASLLFLAIWLSFSLRLGESYPLFEQHSWLPSSQFLAEDYGFPLGMTDMAWLMIAAPFIGIPIFVRMGLYRAIIRFLSHRAILTVVKAVLLYSVIWGFLAFFLKLEGVPRSVIIINAFVALVFVGGVRMMMRSLFAYFERKETSSNKNKINILIFGAGNAGRQIAQSMLSGHEFHLCGFADDDRRLHGRELMGVSIIDPADLEAFIHRCDLAEILLAIPSAETTKRREILERLRHYPVRVRTLPGINEIIGGKVSLRDMHELDLNDLLGRQPIETDSSLIAGEIENRVVLVTGAGGTIGSELSRQILRHRPKTLLLFELNEYALYAVHGALLELLARMEEQASKSSDGARLRALPKIIPILGSVIDFDRISEVMQAWKPAIVYHAAAYKHVPMVEHNAAEGLKNNLFGTITLARAAIEAKVSNLVFISTDKAVRPTNIMGASKRLAEMSLQALAAEREIDFQCHEGPSAQLGNQTHISMVRFGNVLGSSGSVVPLFRKQIEHGGPITLTDPEVTRYFMTISEAAQLVLQAGSLYHARENGSSSASANDAGLAEVFLLDMGEPVKILDLARRMVELSGLRVKDERTPQGDIEIEIAGLRPGEKLYEELLISENPMPTRHPRIFKAREAFLSWRELQPQLRALRIAVINNDVESIRNLLERLVAGYAPDPHIADWVYQEQLLLS